MGYDSYVEQENGLRRSPPPSERNWICVWIDWCSCHLHSTILSGVFAAAVACHIVHNLLCALIQKPAIHHGIVRFSKSHTNRCDLILMNLRF